MGETQANRQERCKEAGEGLAKKLRFFQSCSLTGRFALGKLTCIQCHTFQKHVLAFEEQKRLLCKACSPF